MKRLHLLSALLVMHAAGVASAAPAHVQNKRFKKDGAAVETMRDFSFCVARGNRKLVERYLQVDPTSSEARKFEKILIDHNCLDRGSLTFQPPLFRWGLYEALYTFDYSDRPVPSFDNVPATVDIVTLTPESSDKARMSMLTSVFGECVVRGAPGPAKNLLKSKVASKEETGALQVLQPHLNGCLPAGSDLTFSRPSLRGLIAEALFKLTKSHADLSAKVAE